MRVTVDVDRCCASGQCVEAAPDVFDQDDDTGLVVLRAERPTAAQLPGVRRAVAVCPTGCLGLADR
ncbi:ferredoxin [Actinocatenispora rupis]|uniref:Ferredoxin n=1 Tax=Actinocatenispora rupis TaxID=519421 RepID=A0A8J3J8L8_9ACTN|nr:ferredoxin [Actinocatenispora rupis]GID12144.1 ferredoxin [Actinocatenispora rupis]